MSDTILGASGTRADQARAMLSKVPQVTLFFWIIKVLCTTVGETAADWLNMQLRLGLTGTTLVMSVLLLVALFFQMRAREYKPPIYWIVVVLLSVVGTLITDNMSDNFHVPLAMSTAMFATALVITFAWWYMSERTLSIHSIYTTKRESFYWAAILFTFALGTAAGDLVAERYAVGYLATLGLVAAIIAVIAFAHFVLKLNGILAFWLAYILTRPLGASAGDYLSQSHKDGGLGLGPTVTSIIFLAAILVLVIYLAVTKKDAVPEQAASNSKTS